ncbi:MAG: GNAT family N-acetyltransferase [Brevinema sp.]
MFNITMANAEDYAGIIALGKEFDLSPYVVDPIFTSMTDNLAPAALTEQLLAGMRVLVAKSNSTVVGFLAYTYEDRMSNFLKLEDPGAPRCASILFVAVDSNYRRRSIASSLLKTCKENCLNDGVQLLHVSTDYGNEAAFHLYQKHGFNLDTNFHLYRIYSDQLASTLTVQAIRGMQAATTWAEPLDKMIARRPSHWYHAPGLKRSGVESYMLYQLKEQLKSHKLSVIQKVLYNKTVGLILRQEKEKEAFYGLNGSVWTITDLIENGVRGEQLPDFIQYVLYHLPNFLMAEVFVEAADYETQRMLRKANMHYVYGRISLSTTDLS